ncbi:MAG: alpha/beta hydrolase [Phycisphaerae bacterium]|nr:alpha/beta hydrolase [Phycisphaerae bacterium]
MAVRASALVIASLLMVAFNAGCTDARLARYSDDRLLEEYHYALGENYIEVNGIQWCYQEYGTGDPVVILPGLGSTLDYWQLNIPVLAEQYHVIAVDLPGFGRTSKPDAPYDLTWETERICEFLDAKGVRRARLVGVSMGGHLALLIARYHPERVEQLVLVGASGNWRRPGFLLNFGIWLVWRDAVVTDYLRAHWARIFHELFAHETPMTEQIFRYQMAVRANKAKFGPQGRASARALHSILYSTIRDELDAIKVPTLLIWGEHDTVHPRDGALHFRENLPDARLVIVKDAAHAVMADQPAIFNRLVLDFLRSGTAGVSDDY